MAAAEEGGESSLQNLFDDAFQSFNALENKFESTSGDAFQNEVKKIMKMLEDATRKVSLLGIFSTNEEMEEVSTNDLRFFLLPALLGSLTTKSNSEDRLSLLQTAEVYFKDFLQRCNDYGISKVNSKYFEDKSGQTERVEAIPDLIETAKQREEKILRYKAVKEMESKLEEYKKLVDNENVDEEVKRNYFLTLIKWWILQSIDELDSIKKEKELVERFSNMPAGANRTPSKKPNTRVQCVICL